MNQDTDCAFLEEYSFYGGSVHITQLLNIRNFNYEILSETINFSVNKNFMKYRLT